MTTEHKPHSVLRDLSERWLGDDGDLSSDEITVLARGYIDLVEQVQSLDREAEIQNDEAERLHEQLEAIHRTFERYADAWEAVGTTEVYGPDMAAEIRKTWRDAYPAEKWPGATAFYRPVSSPASSPPVIEGPMLGHHIPIQPEEWEGVNPASEPEAEILRDEEAMDDLRRADEQSDDDAVDYDDVRRSRFGTAPDLGSDPDTSGASPEGNDGETGAA